MSEKKETSMQTKILTTKLVMTVALVITLMLTFIPEALAAKEIGKGQVYSSERDCQSITITNQGEKQGKYNIQYREINSNHTIEKKEKITVGGDLGHVRVENLADPRLLVECN